MERITPSKCQSKPRLRITEKRENEGAFEHLDFRTSNQDTEKLHYFIGVFTVYRHIFCTVSSNVTTTGYEGGVLDSALDGEVEIEESTVVRVGVPVLGPGSILEDSAFDEPSLAAPEKVDLAFLGKVVKAVTLGGDVEMGGTKILACRS